MSADALGEVRVPSLGESIREATVAKWLKSVGDSVRVDEILLELETDKVTLEVASPTTGILVKIQVDNGGKVAVGDLLGMVALGETPSSQIPQTFAQNKDDTKMTQTKVSQTVQNEFVEKFAPSVRKLAEELNINPKEVNGTGRGGRVTKEDVLLLRGDEGDGVLSTSSPAIPKQIQDAGSIKDKALVSPLLGSPGPQKSDLFGYSAQLQRPIHISDRREERVKMTRLRQRIAERLKEAQNTAAILTTFNEIDMSSIHAIRTKYREAFEKKHGIRLGMMSFFVKACIQALREFPAVNAEIEGDEIIYKNYYDIGVAVSAPQGLVVPIVRNADMLSFAELEKVVASLALKARDGKLSIEDMTGGTFTISNGGVFGSLMATPILNPPQTGILGMHKIEDRPVVVNGRIEIRPMMYLALSYDHRVVDGRESVTFLVHVKEHLENPERLLLDL